MGTSSSTGRFDYREVLALIAQQMIRAGMILHCISDLWLADKKLRVHVKVLPGRSMESLSLLGG